MTWRIWRRSIHVWLLSTVVPTVGLGFDHWLWLPSDFPHFPIWLCFFLLQLCLVIRPELSNCSTLEKDPSGRHSCWWARWEEIYKTIEHSSVCVWMYSVMTARAFCCFVFCRASPTTPAEPTSRLEAAWLACTGTSVVLQLSLASSRYTTHLCYWFVINEKIKSAIFLYSCNLYTVKPCHMLQDVCCNHIKHSIQS